MSEANPQPNEANEPAASPQADNPAVGAAVGGNVNPDINMLMDVNMALSVVVGKSEMKLRDLLNLSKGTVIELDKLAGEPLDILANGKLIAHGDVVSVNGKYGIRLTSVPKPQESERSAGKGA
jgi:flagellar motor switch protein FliN/FliY